MSDNSAKSMLSRRSFVAATGTVVASTALGRGTVSGIAQPVPSPPITVDYPVTIDLLPNNKLVYKVRGAIAPDPLPVKVDKTITWSVNDHGKPYHITILFQKKQTPLVDPNGAPLNAVHGSHQDEGTLKVGGKVRRGAQGHSYKYAVAVFDDYTGVTYSDDPKIIVGTGSDDAIQELSSALEEVKDAERALSDRPKQKEKAKSIESQLDKLIAELK